MPDAIDDARQLIESRLAALDAEADSLRRALQGLGETGAAPRRPGRPKKRRSAKHPRATASSTKARPAKRKGARAPRGQRRQQLLAAVKANPEARPAEHAAAIGISANQVHALIAKARKDKLLVKRGKGYALKG